MVSVVAATTREYSAVKVGEFIPPNPSPTEMIHLKSLNLKVGEKLPFPLLDLEMKNDEKVTSFMEVSASASEAALEPQRVPHNWCVFVFVFCVFVFFLCLFFLLLLFFCCLGCEFGRVWGGETRKIERGKKNFFD